MCHLHECTAHFDMGEPSFFVKLINYIIASIKKMTGPGTAQRVSSEFRAC